MKITIKTIPHQEQKYETVGDYWRDLDGSLNIVVSEMSDPTMETLVAIHELVEVLQMEKHNIPLIASNEFDIIYEKERQVGMHDQDDEPGDDPRCPYRREHRFAENIERQVAFELGVDWDEYGAKVGAVK